TPAELACANPNAPCNLPIAFVGDPPLEPVVARTYELGARGTLKLGDGLGWSLGLFRTDLTNDILFTVVETGGGGLFQNVARTRRQGVEASIHGGAWKRLTYSASYAFIDATYQSSVTLASVTDANGIPVQPGDRIPGIPRHSLKVGAEVGLLDSVWGGS